MRCAIRDCLDGLLTARPPVPAHPRLGARLAYRVQRVLRPRPGLRWLSARIEASGPARTLFTGAQRQAKQALFSSRIGRQINPPATAYVGPVCCAQELHNGPGGGGV